MPSSSGTTTTTTAPDTSHTNRPTDDESHSQSIPFLSKELLSEASSQQSTDSVTAALIVSDKFHAETSETPPHRETTEDTKGYSQIQSTTTPSASEPPWVTSTSKSGLENRLFIDVASRSLINEVTASQGSQINVLQTLETRPESASSGALTGARRSSTALTTGSSAAILESITLSSMTISSPTSSISPSTDDAYVSSTDAPSTTSSSKSVLSTATSLQQATSTHRTVPVTSTQGRFSSSSIGLSSQPTSERTERTTVVQTLPASTVEQSVSCPLFDEWGPFSACNATCGTYSKTRVRKRYSLNNQSSSCSLDEEKVSCDLQPCNPMSTVEKDVAEAMMEIGCIWLLSALGASVVTFLCLRNWGYLEVIHASQDLSFLVAHLLVVSVASRNDNIYSHDVCRVSSLGLQYFFLVNFALQAFEALHIYTVLTNVVMGDRALIGIKAVLAASWGAPAVIAGITGATSYSKLMSAYSCWVNIGDSSTVIIAHYGPVVAIGVTTAVLLEATGAGTTSTNKHANCAFMQAGPWWPECGFWNAIFIVGDVQFGHLIITNKYGYLSSFSS